MASVIGYARLSKAADNGYSIGAQEDAIREVCRYKGLDLLRVESDPAASGNSMKRRPGLDRARKACERGEADGIVFAKLDRATRSVRDFCELLDWAQKGGHRIVIRDPDIDLDSAFGPFIAHVLMAFAELERKQIAARTKVALAEARKTGIKLGAPRRIGSEARGKAHRLAAEGKSQREVAAALNLPRTTVQRILATQP